jgi:hypothetical protein
MKVENFKNPLATCWKLLEKFESFIFYKSHGVGSFFSQIFFLCVEIVFFRLQKCKNLPQNENWQPSCSLFFYGGRIFTKV